MLVVVSYDVSQDNHGRKRLRKIAKQCQNYGQRVQFSVFECLVDPEQWVNMKNSLLQLYDPEFDSLRFYYLGANYKKRIEHFGVKDSLDLQSDPLIL